MPSDEVGEPPARRQAPVFVRSDRRRSGHPGDFYAEPNTVALALHVLDELVHHGAEAGLSRDLYLHRPQRCD